MFTAEVKYSKRPGASYAKYGNFVTTVILNNNFVGAIFVIWSEFDLSCTVIENSLEYRLLYSESNGFLI